MGGQEHLLHERDLLIDQIPGIKRRFPNYQKYAEATVATSLSASDLEGATVLEAYRLASVILENLGNQKCKLYQLPQQTQLSALTEVSSGTSTRMVPRIS